MRGGQREEPSVAAKTLVETCYECEYKAHAGKVRKTSSNLAMIVVVVSSQSSLSWLSRRKAAPQHRQWNDTCRYFGTCRCLSLLIRWQLMQ